MSYVHPFSKRCDKSEIDLFSVPPTQQSLERGRWIDYAPLSSVENPDSAITYLIAGTDEYIDLSKTILTVTGKILMGDGKTDLSGGNQTSVAPVNNFLQFIQTSGCLSEWEAGHSSYGYIRIPGLHRNSLEL